jgi:hypothetical protein
MNKMLERKIKIRKRRIKIINRKQIMKRKNHDKHFIN